jgi:hypothetical protein
MASTGVPYVSGDAVTFTGDAANTPSNGADDAAAKTRADADKLAEKVVALAASGDGIESGFSTSEFWLTVLAVVADLTGPAWGLTLSPHEQALAAAALVLGYAGFRTWRKNGGAAKLAGRVSMAVYAIRHKFDYLT